MTKSKSQVLKENSFEKRKDEQPWTHAYYEFISEFRLSRASKNKIYEWIESSLTHQKSEIIKELEDKFVFIKERIFWKKEQGIKGLDLRDMYDADKVDDVIEQLKK